MVKPPAGAEASAALVLVVSVLTAWGASLPRTVTKVKDKVIRAEAARRIITLVFIVLIIKILRNGYKDRVGLESVVCRSASATVKVLLRCHFFFGAGCDGYA
jgi:hypothetical protein